MQGYEAVRIALRSMRAARLRTALTTLGIVAGVAVVIVLVGLSNGVRDGFAQQFGDLNRMIIVSKVAAAMPGGNGARPITESDMQAVIGARERGGYSDVAPNRFGSGIVKYEGRTMKASVNSSSENFLKIRNMKIVAGRMFNEADNEQRAKVVVIGRRVVNQLFYGNTEEALDKDIQVGRFTMKVIGVFGYAGDNMDHFVMMPLTTSRMVMGGGENLNGFGVMANTIDHVPGAVNVLNEVMDQRHNVKEPGFRDFDVAPMTSEITRINNYLSVLTWLTYIIGGLSLFVGGIGVANVMMVTVKSRTAEIGIRKAIGARRSSIMKQFLAEALVLAGMGGLFGAAMGVGLTFLAARFVPIWLPEVGEAHVSPATVTGAFGISLVIGLLAGVYPAVRASRLHPIDALRA